MVRKSLVALFLLGTLLGCLPARGQQRTYCNPLNIDYGFAEIPSAIEQGKHRATADPVIVVFKGIYCLFSTNQHGYWWSNDLDRWTFVSRSFLKPRHGIADDLCAPAAFVRGDSLFLLGSTTTADFPLWYTTDPRSGRWSEAVDSMRIPAWDPDLFLDDDGRVYLYYGSSNDFPIYGQELDPATFAAVGPRLNLLRLDDGRHGWERFGEHNDNTFLRPFIEGAWMTKHRGRYYLQYGAPGTEFSGYADGVYIADAPLGPFRYQQHNPFSYKPGGFARGAGHGSTFQDLFGGWWHVATTAISVKNNFERRISMWPAGFDRDGVLFCNTAYGDYPHVLPSAARPPAADLFTGWMLLNYEKPVRVSSALGGHPPNFAVDEDIRTAWSAATGKPGEWLESDLGAVCTVRAVQVNYADEDAQLIGKQLSLYHRYVITASKDGRDWKVVVDKRKATSDVPNDYVELSGPVEARYLRIENVHVPTGKFALSGFRAFGRGHGAVPDSVKGFTVLRGESERRNVWIKWRENERAVGYSIFYGIAPDKLYTSIMVYGANEYVLAALDSSTTYFMQIEAFNEAGIGRRTAIVKVE